MSSADDMSEVECVHTLLNYSSDKTAVSYDQLSQCAENVEEEANE